MQWIKLKADKIFDGYRFHENKILLLRRDGVVEGLVNESDCSNDIQYFKGILSPGFINAHCHLELSHMLGQIEENTGLMRFVRQVVEKRKHGEEEILAAITLAERTMIDNGIVAVGDICNTTHTIAQKQKSNLYYHNFIEVLGFDPAVAEKNFEIFNTTLNRFLKELPHNKSSLTPHAPYSISAVLWELVVKHAAGKILSIHNQETDDENKWFMAKEGAFATLYDGLKLNTDWFIASGKSSLQTYLSRFLPGGQLLLVHNVYTVQRDIDFANTTGNTIYWCLCPNANQYISGRLPDVEMFLRNNCLVVLGTDSLASNHQLNIWEEIKTIQKKFPAIPLETMLQWATLNGAKALQIDGQYGSFEKGKKPGLVLIGETGAHKVIV